MSTDLNTTSLRSLVPGTGRARSRQSRSERRRLARVDRRGARLAELHLIRELLDSAATVISAGWVQHSWFAVTDQRGQRSLVHAHNIHVVTESSLVGACLVGGIVHAAGGPSSVATQLVQRTLDLTWHALNEDEDRAVRWCPAPPVRAAHVRDLTRWNDHPDRTQSEVAGLLHSAIRTAEVEKRLLYV